MKDLTKYQYQLEQLVLNFYFQNAIYMFMYLISDMQKSYGGNRSASLGQRNNTYSKASFCAIIVSWKNVA